MGSVINSVGEAIFGKTEKVGAPSAADYGFDQEKYDQLQGQRQGFVGQLGNYQTAFSGQYDPESGNFLGGMQGQYGDLASKMGGMGSQYADLASRESAAYQGLAGQVPDLSAQYGTTAGGIQDLSGQVGTAASRYGGLVGGVQDLSGQVSEAAQGYAGYGSELSGLQGNYAQMAQMGSTGLGALGGVTDKMQALQEQAAGPNAYQRETEMLQGQMQASRQASDEAARERMRRGMAESGNRSPQAMAALEADLAKQGAQASRDEALSAAMGGQQLGQARTAQQMGLIQGLAGERGAMAGMLQSGTAGQAGLVGQRAGLTGQQISALQAQQGLSSGATQLQASLTGDQISALQAQQSMGNQAVGQQLSALQAQQAMGSQALGQRADLMGMGFGAERAGLAGQMGVMQGQAGMLGLQEGALSRGAGFLGSQLQDVVAQQNAQEQARLASLGAQMSANQFNASQQSAGEKLIGAGVQFAGAAAASDIRLKENISPISNALNAISGLNGYFYNYKYPEKHGETHGGVMAHDVREVAPEAVMTGSDGYDMVNYTHVIGMLVEAVKELKDEVKVLKEKVS